MIVLVSIGHLNKHIPFVDGSFFRVFCLQFLFLVITVDIKLLKLNEIKFGFVFGIAELRVAPVPELAELKHSLLIVLVLLRGVRRRWRLVFLGVDGILG